MPPSAHPRPTSGSSSEPPSPRPESTEPGRRARRLKARPWRRLGFFLVLVVVALVYGLVVRSGFNATRDQIDESWDRLCSLLHERSALSLEFADAVDQLAAAEESTDEGQKDALEAATENLRAASERLEGATTPPYAANAEAALSAAIGKVLLEMSEREELRNDESYRDSLEKLAAAQSAIVRERSRYNNLVAEANSKISKGAGMFVAPLVRIEPYEFFNAVVEEEEP
jgi:hypothetical protein